MARRPDVLVVGGGIIGLACARELDRQGHAVAILEGREPGSGASNAAAGMLSPLAEEPRSGPLFDACRMARDRWPDWAAELEAESGCGVGLDRSGALVASRGGADDAWLDELRRAAMQLGEACESISIADLRRHLPAIAPDVGRALLLPGEYRVDNERTVAALVTDLERRGVALHRGRTVHRVEADTGTVRLHGPGWRVDAALAILAAGAWSGQIAGLPPLPVRPVRGQMISFEGIDWPWQGSLRGRSIYAVRREPRRLLVGATVEEVGFDPSTTGAAADELRHAAQDLFPQLEATACDAHWAGLRPGTPDDLPILGWLPDTCVVIASGHFRNGILLAPWTADAVVTLVEGDGESDPEPQLSPRRFLSDCGRTSPLGAR